MPSIDMPLAQMREYKPSLYREADFEEYWSRTLTESDKQPLKAEFTPYDLPAKGLQAYAVRFDGFRGGRIAGWYVRPAGKGTFPGLCMYHGYSMWGARPLDMIATAAQGIAVLSVDCRGQNGDSQDVATYPGGHQSGWMTKGIRDPETYYYRYVYTDCVRALELLAGRDEVDESRLAITGGSQGGALSLAVSALSDRPILSLPDIPFLSDFRRAIDITPAGPYPEIPAFLKAHPELQDQVIRTLSYCDNLNLAGWIKCRTIICNCLWDDICPPSTIFGVYNHLTCEKQMEIYPYHKHEIPYEHYEKKMRLLLEALKP